MTMSKQPDESGASSPRSSLLAHIRRADSGATLAFTAVATIVLLGSTALAVDLGMLVTARVQSQRAADSGALAGAQRLAALGASDQQARDEAKSFANRHNVLTNSVQVTDSDVDVSGDTVRVRVHHTIGTLFARVLGIDAVDVSTVAAAEAVPSSGAECPLPIVAVDGYTDNDDDGLFDFTGSPSDTYIKCDSTNTGSCTGYNVFTGDPNNDIGLLIEVKSAGNDQPDGTVDVKEKSCGAEQPSWFCWMDIPATTGSGNPDLRDAIDGCSGDFEFSLGQGDNVTASSGNRQAIVRHTKEFIENSPDASHTWNPNAPLPDGGTGCVVEEQGSTSCVATSDRIRPLAVVDPTTIGGTGNHANADVAHLVSVFMDHVSDDFETENGSGPQGNWNIYLRLLGAAQGGTGTGGPEGSLLQTVILIE